MKGYIYKIENPAGKIYIGQTIKLSNRKSRYRHARCKGQNKLYNSIVKYSWDNHKFTIIQEVQFNINCPIDNILLDILEIYWINEYNSFSNGLNSTKGGKGSSGFKHTEEAKEKLRANSRKGQKLSEETKLLISKAQLGKKLKPLSEETKLKISKSRCNYIISNETQLKISNSLKGKKYKKR